MFLRYTQALITRTMQLAVCTRHHTLERLCRWLLSTLDRIDRIDSGNLVMTQELIASMPGVIREGITAAAGRLQHADPPADLTLWGAGKVTH